MKKYLVALLCLCMTISALSANMPLVNAETNAPSAVTVEANQAVTAPSFSELISEGTWGTKAVHIDKDSQNAELYDYNGQAEEVAADMYFQWDEENLYVGMVTSDADLRGDDASYKGDGIQIRVGKGAERTSFVDFYVTLDAENKPSTAGWNQTDEAGNTLPLPEHNMLLNADGTEIHIMMAIPLERLGLSAEAGEIGDGTELNVSLLRISGTKDGSYAGWLAWGAFFAPNHDYHKTLADCNIIVLKDDVAANGRVVIANKADAAPSFDEFIREGTWGTKAVHINKDSYNAELYNYNGVAEDVSADMYFQWDEENLYVGMVTSDADLRGDEASYKGDGIQIRVGKGTERTSFVDFYVTLDAENKPSTAGWNQTDEAGNTLPLPEHNMLLNADGTEIHMMVAIPLERLGLSAEAGEVGDGTELNVSLLRISGTKDGSYAGWLAWGAFFAPNHDYHKSLSDCNIIVFHDPDAKAEGGNDSFTSALTDISESSKIPSAAGGMNDGYKIVQTETATYAVYADWYPVVNGSNFDGGLVNDFTLQKIVNGTSTEVGQGLSWNSDIDVVADADGNVYVVGGSSSWAIGRLSNVYDYTATPEKAILQIHAYDDTVGFMQGYSISKNFTEKSTDNYKYLTTTIDQTNNKIYTAYVGPVAEGAIIEIFEFDIATMTWSDNTIVSTLPGLPEKATAFVDEGVNIICNANDSIYKVNAQGTEEIGQGTLVDAYNDTTGNLHVMYQTEGAQTLSYMVENETAVETSIPASGLTRMFEANGKVMAVSTVADVAATVKLYEIGETVTEGNTVVLDKVVRFRDVLMVTRKDNGSVASDDLTLLFPGNRISISSWYHAVLPLNTATE